MRITLTVTAGPHEGRVFEFSGHDTFLVGRSRHAHMQLSPKDRFCSRMHFMVEVNPPYCRLLDMGSNNGTFVNGQKVAMVELRDGDEVRAGRSSLRVNVEVPTTSPGDEPAEKTVLSATTAAGPPLATFESWPAPRELRFCPACAGPGEIAIDGKPAWLCPNCQQQVRQHPQPIPGYQMIRKLGRGSMGTVWLALCLSDPMLVALKIVTPAVSGTRSLIERFLREVNILRGLNHPHIVSFRDAGEADGELFFAMDYVPGQDANQLLRKEGPLEVGRAVDLVCQLLEALDYAHAQGIVHRDVKPSNMLVATKPDGEREGVKVADFGLARTYQASQLSGLTLMGDIGGTPGFMAPEQIIDFRQTQPPADQYSAAATLYKLLTGHYVHDFPPNVQQWFQVILTKNVIPIQHAGPTFRTPWFESSTAP